jgi:hypothetical protein
MSKTSVLFLFTIIVICCCSAVAAETFDKYISAADIEKVTGFQDVKLSKNSQHGSAGTLEFKNKEGKTILSVKFNKSSLYDRAEKAKVVNVKGDIKGIGEDAFYASNFSDSPNYLCFKKGNFSVDLAAFVKREDGKPFLTLEQLKELAKIIASRI